MLNKVPPPPFTTPVVDSQGRLTRPWEVFFKLHYEKTGKASPIPTESVQPNLIFNASNNVRVRWVDVNAAGGRVRVDGPTDGASWERYEGDNSAQGYRVIGPFPATQFDNKPYNFYYYVTYDPQTALYACTTDFRETLKEGLYILGSCQASASFGGGGSTSGGGGSATPSESGESSGGAGEVSPGIRVGGYGRLL